MHTARQDPNLGAPASMFGGLSHLTKICFKQGIRGSQ